MLGMTHLSSCNLKEEIPCPGMVTAVPVAHVVPLPPDMFDFPPEEGEDRCVIKVCEKLKSQKVKYTLSGDANSCTCCSSCSVTTNDVGFST